MEVGARPRLCEVSVDPTCAYDRSRTRPLVTDMLFRAMARQLADALASRLRLYGWIQIRPVCSRYGAPTDLG